MLKRLLLLIVAALVAPVPTVWLFVEYGEWLHARFLDVGLPDDAAQFGVGVVILILVLGLIMVLTANVVLNTEKIWHWIKTGKLHA